MRKASYIFRNGIISDPESQLNGKKMDIFVEDGRFREISSKIESQAGVAEVELNEAFVSPGLFDMQVCSGEPGYEERETLAETSKASIAGGITDILLMPSLVPVTDHRGQAEYLIKIAAPLAVGVHIAGTLSAGMKGEDLAEFYDMRQGGVLAFTDDKSPVDNTVLLHLALQYNQVSGGLLMLHCEDSKLRLGGKVNEGPAATNIGMKGTPAISEELGVIRALTLARYHNSRIHLSGISTAGAVELIRKAKTSGVQVSCSVYAHHLYFNDEELLRFDSNFKVWPPIRSEDDRNALIQGLKDDTIDVICSDHRPMNPESKDVEFDYAAYGMRGLETLFAASYQVMGSTELLLRKIAYAPRELLGLPVQTIQKGNQARFFVFNDETYDFSALMLNAKSKNTPFIGKKLRGRIKGSYTPEGGWIE